MVQAGATKGEYGFLFRLLGLFRWPRHLLSAHMDETDDEKYRPPKVDRLYGEALSLSVDMDLCTFGELDDWGLLDVAVSLSKWRDQLA